MKSLCPSLPRVLRGSPSCFCSPDFALPVQTLQASQGRTFLCSYLILNMGGGKKGLILARDCAHQQQRTRGLSPNTVTFPYGHSHTNGSLQGIQVPQLQWDSRAFQTPRQGRSRAALFPSLYLPDNGTIQQVLNVLMGFRIASVAHLPQGHFTPP